MPTTVLNKPETAVKSGETRSVFFPACLAITFLVALALRLWFNFYGSHMNAYAMGDAYEYLSNARALQTFIADVPPGFLSNAAAAMLPGTAPALIATVKSQLAPLGGFAISGPVYPIVLLWSYIISGHAVDVSSWQAPIIAQCIITALTCVFVSLGTAKAWDKNIGIVAGVLTALYPAFIVNSGRLYTENLACLILAILCWLVISVICSEKRDAGDTGFQPASTAFFALIGFTLAALQLTRSVMFLLAPIMLLATVSAVPRRQRLQLGVILAVCYVLALLPWMAFGKLAWGNGSPIVDRVGHYNFVVGNDVDAQGFLGYPYPDVYGIEQKSLLTLGKEAYNRSHSRFFSLNLDKPARLLKFPWNDFRASIGPLTQFGQVLIHQLLLLFSALGVLIALCVGYPKQQSGRQLASRLVIAAVGAVQATYLLFITIPRYNLTVMPILLIFAAAGFVTIARTIKTGPAQKASLMVAGASLLLFVAERFCNEVPMLLGCAIKILALTALLAGLFKLIDVLQGYRLAAKIAAAVLAISLIPSLCLPIRAHGRWYEQAITLSDRNPTVTQTITIPASAGNRPLFLAIDSDGWKPLRDDLRFEINGHPVSGPIIPQLPLLQDLRQPAIRNAEAIWDFEWVFNCLTRVGGICNGDVRQWFLLPIPSDFVTGDTVTVRVTAAPGKSAKLFASQTSAGNRISIPSFTKASYEKAFYGVENDDGLNDSRFDQRITVPGPRQPVHVNLRVVAAPLESAGSAGILPALTKQFPSRHLRSDESVTAQLTNLPTFSPTDTWLIRLRGKVHSSTGAAKPGITLVVNAKDPTGKPITYSSPWTPSIMDAGPSPSSFDIAFPLIPSSIGHSIDSFQTTFYGDSPINHPVSETLAKPTKPDVTFDSLSLEISRMPQLPPAPKLEVY
jgi:hypothetical protein